MGKKLSDETIQEIIKLYQSGMTPTKVGRKFGIKNNSVTRILRNLGIDRDQIRRVPQEDIDKIIEKYTAGISAFNISQELDIHEETVRRILKRNKIILRKSGRRKHKIDESYFEIIDTEEKAYFLGFMYADGNVHKTLCNFKIGLHPKDQEILEKFSQILYGKVHLYFDLNVLSDDGKPYPVFMINRRKMAKDLVKLGCMPNKTFLIRFPTTDIVPQHLLRHFMRGFFDGDGCLSLANPKRPAFDITSNRSFIEGMMKFVKQEIDMNCPKLGQKKEDTETRSVQFRGFNHVKKILGWLYKDATIYMARKHNLYLEMFRLEKEHHNRKMKKFEDPGKYGTTYIPEINGIRLTTDNLKKMTDEEKKNLIESLFEFYRKNGFPYTEISNDDLLKEFITIKEIKEETIEKEGKILTTYHQSGLDIFKHFSPHFFEVNSNIRRKKSMLDTFEDDKLLKDVISNRLLQNCQMTGNMLKQGLANSKIAYKASIFNTIIGKYVYSKFSKENDLVYDCSMGFGQRLVGALSVPHRLTYIGVDPMERSINSGKEIFNFYKRSVPGLNKEGEFICCGAEDFCYEEYKGKINLIFSSIPYWQVESYEENSTQAYYERDYVSFINIWWRKVADNFSQLLVEDGVIALNVAEKVDGFHFSEDICNVLKEKGFELVDTYNIQITRNIKFGNKKGQHKYEPLFIFKKKTVSGV